MRQLLQIFFLFSLTVLQGEYCNCQDSNTRKIYYNAFSNNSTSPDYVVFTALNLQTNLSKEICCESDNLINEFLEDNTSFNDTAAMMATYKKALKMYDSILISKVGDYSFSFKSFESLKGIGFYGYVSDSVDYYNAQASGIIDSIKENYDPDKITLLKDYTNNVNLYLIHSLYKNGILCGRQCVSGYITIKEILK